jgi:hypothetical protein
LGIWGFFRSVTTKYPYKNTNLLFAVVFLAPSTLVWASELLKDTICIGLIGFILSSFFQLVELKKTRFNLMKQVVLWTMLWKIKPYLTLAFLVALFVWGAVYAYQSIENKKHKRLIITFVFFAFMIAGSQIRSGISYLESQNSYHSVLQKIKGYHSEYERTKELGASVYTLGEIEYTPLGILQKIPEAVSTAFFRPFPWEANKPLLLVMSLENIALLSIIVFIKHWRNLFSLAIWREPTFVMSIVFVGILSIVVGLTSYNFGLLMRLKTPMIPFLGIALHFIAREND